MGACVSLSYREKGNVCGIMPQYQPKRAGGWNVVDGGYDFHLVKRSVIRPWREAVKAVIEHNQSATIADPRIQFMLNSASSEWSTYAAPAYNQWPSLTPLFKAQSLIAWILKQETPSRKHKRTVLDIIASGIAGNLYDTLKPQPRHDSYARAVSVARPVWFLLRPEYRTYEHDNGHGFVTQKKVWINKKVRLRSRYACQRIEASIRKHVEWFIEQYHDELIEEIRRRGLV
jgi:hypothetical protein